jgi:hypothetical protein
LPKRRRRSGHRWPDWSIRPLQRNIGKPEHPRSEAITYRYARASRRPGPPSSRPRDCGPGALRSRRSCRAATARDIGTLVSCRVDDSSPQTYSEDFDREEIPDNCLKTAPCSQSSRTSPARCKQPEEHRKVPNSRLATSGRRAIRSTTPVGIFPGGDTFPGGDADRRLSDISGNVFEWTSSKYLDYPYRSDAGRDDAENKSDPREYAGRFLRGGS